MDDLKQEVLLRRIPWKRLWPDAAELMQRHREELARSAWPLRPDHRQIEELEKAGGLICIEARDPEDLLLGYGIWYLQPSLESAGVLLAQQGPWYVRKEARAGGLGLRILDFGLAELRRAGVNEVWFHHSANTPNLGVVFRQLGAKPAETSYVLRLED